MIRVGITGGIGSGKSTACSMFAERGVQVYDSDAAARRLMNGDEELKRRLKELFGDAAYVGGVLDRSYIASQVFGDEERLRQLNAAVHPSVRADFRRWCGEHADEDYVLLESAILFESGFDSEVDRTLAVVAPRELRIERVCLRSGLAREEVEQRMAVQMSDDELRERADYTVANITLDYLRSDVVQLDKIFRYEARRNDIRH